MSFSIGRVKAVFWKDSLDLSKNKGLLWSMSALPMALVVVPVWVVWAYAKDMNDPSLRAMAAFYQPLLQQGVNPARFLIDKTLSDWFGLYLMMPVFVPILISSHSVAGEKERRTLEPLLASPLGSMEFLIGKSLGALVPALVLTWLAFLALAAGVNWVAWPYFHELLLPNRMWLFGMCCIVPLFAFFGNGVAVVVSARVNEVRLAQQLSGLCVLPLIGLVATQMAGWLQSGTRYYAVEGGVVLGLDVLLLVVGVRLFDRDRLLSRWS